MNVRRVKDSLVVTCHEEHVILASTAILVNGEPYDGRVLNGRYTIAGNCIITLIPAGKAENLTVQTNVTVMTLTPQKPSHCTGCGTNKVV